MHSVALMMVPKHKATTMTPKLFVVGTLLFSGGIYAMVLTGFKKLGIVTPFGGATLFCAWLSLAL